MTILREKMIGAHAECLQFKKLMANLDSGGVVIITAVDLMPRDTTIFW